MVSMAKSLSLRNRDRFVRTETYASKDKNKPNDRWFRICEVLDGDELKTRKTTATFRGHLKKKKASIRSRARVDDVYKLVCHPCE